MTRVAGLPQTASERAFDMFLKVQHIQSRNKGGGVVFATGTPISNTMAEMFTMQRYLQMTSLRRNLLQHFDSWAGTFGETVTNMERRACHALFTNVIPLGQRPTPCQPRATHWVRGQERASPERAEQIRADRLSRPFRAFPLLHLNPGRCPGLA